jgi:hypothetical protein
MKNTTTNEAQAQALAVLLKSDAMRSALAAEESKRLALHRTAADALLEFEADASELENAAAQVEEARAKLSPLEKSYKEAAHSLLMAEGNLRDRTSTHDQTAGRLRKEAAALLPAIVHRTEAALAAVAHDIRNGYTIHPRIDRLITGARRTVYEANGEKIDAALSQIQAMHQLIEGRLTFEPMPEAEIIQMLSTEAARLMQLSKDAGVNIAYHLPQEIRPGVIAEKPERRPGQYMVPIVPG